MDLPPIPHITQNYIPLRALFLAVSERCGKELANILRTSENQFSNMARKEQFLKFVVAARQEYVKLYVLCKWAVVYQNISTAIDVTNWLHGQVNCFNNVVAALFHLQAGLGSAKSPWADLETALEVLKFGAPAPTAEAVHFIPRQPLSNACVFRVLRRLDVLIAMRLALHERLPQHYHSYKVLDGRARFEVGCMWVEVSIADEEVEKESRFFFVDAGLTGEAGSGSPAESSASSATSRSVRVLEHTLNALLQTSLVAALNYVSQLSAIYQLQLFDRQLRLAEDRMEVWSGVISHELRSTELRIRCFVNTQAPAETTISVTKTAPFELVVPAEYGITLNARPSKAAVTHVLTNIARYHAAKKLEHVRAPWISRVNDFCISFQCYSRTVELSVDPTSGLLALSGNGPLFADMQNRLNTQPDISIVDALSRLRAQLAMDSIATRAEAAGWHAQRNVKLAPDEYAHIKPAIYLLTLRLPNDFSGWSLCAAFGPAPKPRWFASRVQCEQRRWVLGPIHPCEEIDEDDEENIVGYGRFVELSVIYKRQFVLFELMRELAQQNVRHKLTLRQGEHVVVADIRQVLPQAIWAQSGLMCSVSNGLLLMEGRARPGLLQALGHISQRSANSTIMVDGNSNKFVLSTDQQAGCQHYLQYLSSALGQLHYAANSLTSATSLGLEVRSATLSSIEIKYVTPNGVLVVQNNAKIIFGENNPQKPLAPFLPKIHEHSKSSLPRIVTFLREWYPVWEIVSALQSPRFVLLPQSVNKLRVQFGSRPESPYLELTLRNFRRQRSVNFLTAGNGAEQQELLRNYFGHHVCDGVVPLISGCAVDIGHESVLKEIISALHNLYN